MTSLIPKRAPNNTAIIPLAVSILCLIPFANKAFHIDDPLFIWSAKQIQTSPSDFYGFSVNWYNSEMPMAEVAKNSPGTCYYIALVGALFGWSEVALHIAFLIPAAAAALGTYYLAGQFCSRPAVASLAAVLTPAFLVSSSNVMCDTMMLAFWVWAVFFWVRGMKTNKQLNLFFSAVLIALCSLTKYFGAALVGLLSVYSLIQKRKIGNWLLFLLIPVVVLAEYQRATGELYGRGLLLDAVSFAMTLRWEGSTALFSKMVIGLVFTGGCVATVLFYWPLLWSRRVLVGGVVLIILLIVGLAFAKTTGRLPMSRPSSIGWGFLVQLCVMTVTGVSLLGLAGADFWRCRNAESLLLSTWVLGTFVFVSFVNWTVNARSILPMVPAVGILLMRRIEQRSGSGRRKENWRVAWPLVPAAVVALLVGWADYTWANTARSAAVTIQDRFEEYDGTVRFQGHWGFQYYMEANGYQALDLKYSEPASGDIIIVPSNNCFTKKMSEEKVRQSEVFQIAPWRWLTIMNASLGAGFYSDLYGPLPFVIGPVDLEKYYVFIVK